MSPRTYIWLETRPCVLSEVGSSSARSRFQDRPPRQGSGTEAPTTAAVGGTGSPYAVATVPVMVWTGRVNGGVSRSAARPPLPRSITPLGGAALVARSQIESVGKPNQPAHARTRGTTQDFAEWLIDRRRGPPSDSENGNQPDTGRVSRPCSVAGKNGPHLRSPAPKICLRRLGVLDAFVGPIFLQLATLIAKQKTENASHPFDSR